MIVLNGNHGRDKLSFTVIRSVPGGRRHLAQMLKGEGKINELGEKSEFLVVKTLFTCVVFSGSW